MFILKIVIIWVPLIVFWTMFLSMSALPEWTIALPSFSLGASIMLGINLIEEGLQHVRITRPRSK